jgi:hypothetical protein
MKRRILKYSENSCVTEVKRVRLENKFLGLIQSYFQM